MQLVVNERHQPLERLLVTIAPETQQGCDVAVGRLWVRLHVTGPLGPLSLPNAAAVELYVQLHTGAVEEGAGAG